MTGPCVCSAFLDVGNVCNENDKVTGSDMYVLPWGLGLSWISPPVPCVLAFAQPVHQVHETIESRNCNSRLERLS